MRAAVERSRSPTDGRAALSAQAPAWRRADVRAGARGPAWAPPGLDWSAGFVRHGPAAGQITAQGAVRALQRSVGNAATQRVLAHTGSTVRREPNPPSTAGPGPVPDAANRVGFVREEGLNLRAGPGQTTRSLARLPFGERVHLINDPDPQPGWLRVAVPGLVGYVSAPRIHFPPPELARMDPGLRLIRVAQRQTLWGLVKTMYGIRGDEGSADQNVNHFINAIRAVNKPEAFEVRTDLLDDIGNFLIPGRSASDTYLYAGVDLWIPSFGVAAAMHVGSGTVSGEIAGFLKAVRQKIEDFGTACWAAGKYIPEAIAQNVGEMASGLVHGLVEFAVDAAKILAASTAAGALIGALFGGVGALPGATIGFEIGLLILELYGLYMLVEAIFSIAAKLVTRLGQFVSLVWTADGNRKQLEQAGRTLADALGILVSAALLALAAYLLKRGGKALGETKFAKTVGEQPLAKWLADRQRLTTTRERLRKGEEPAAPAVKVVPKVGDTLEGLMHDSPLTPSQTTVKLDVAQQYAAEMKAGRWNWNDPVRKIIIDPKGNIMSGHHRVVAAELADIKIPESGIYRSSTLQVPEKVRAWSDVIFE